MRCLITVRAERKCGAEEQAEVRSERAERKSGATERSESAENNPENKENTKVESSET
ncbi:MAG: hypothetical protein MUO80_00440 [Dehalococcoidia bacterium]|nr:hypothetical protein [Dehalococcoidia bacterium]